MGKEREREKKNRREGGWKGKERKRGEGKREGR